MPHHRRVHRRRQLPFFVQAEVSRVEQRMFFEKFRLLIRAHETGPSFFGQRTGKPEVDDREQSLRAGGSIRTSGFGNRFERLHVRVEGRDSRESGYLFAQRTVRFRDFFLVRPDGGFNRGFRGNGNGRFFRLYGGRRSQRRAFDFLNGRFGGSEGRRRFPLQHFGDCGGDVRSRRVSRAQRLAHDCIHLVARQALLEVLREKTASETDDVLDEFFRICRKREQPLELLHHESGAARDDDAKFFFSQSPDSRRKIAVVSTASVRFVSACTAIVTVSASSA